jgi:hypothetical protein
MNVKLLGGLIVVFLLSTLGHYLQWEHNGRLVAEKKTLTTQLETSQQNEKAQGTSAAGWEKAATECTTTNQKLSAQKADLEQANSKAAAQVASVVATAQKDLATWQKKYQLAMKNGTCADILNTPLSVCPELTQ